MNPKGGYIYIVTNKNRTTIYTGVTTNLFARSWQHKNGEGSVFSSKYNCTDLVYYEIFETIEEAITREKVLKKWRREWKENLINNLNPDWKDLFEEVREFG